MSEDTFVRDHLRVICRIVNKMIPEGWGLFLFCAPFDERPGRANYISTMTRETAIACMKEFIAKQQDGTGWAKHV